MDFALSEEQLMCRDQRVTTIYEGTNESQRISISPMIEAGL